MTHREAWSYGADPELLHGYELGWLDRGAQSLIRDFGPLDGQGPSGTLAELCRQPGEVAVLDGSCGTGRQLYDLVRFTGLQYGVDTRQVIGDGVSDHDFSNVSREAEVRRALGTNPDARQAFGPKDNRFTYMVRDLRQELPMGKYDLAYAYEVLVHAQPQDVAPIILGLWRSLKLGGVAYFNAGQEQQPAVYEALHHIVALKRGEVWQADSPLPVVEALRQVTHGTTPHRRRVYKIAKDQTRPPWLSGVLGLVR